MDSYYNLERSKQAGGLADKLREAKLGNIELSLLKVLARKMGRETDITTGEIENGCRASLETLENESLLERTAIGRALGRLVDSGFITKTYDRYRATELTKEGRRRKALGLSLVCPEKNNYERRPMGRPRNDKSDMGQWKHCVYHLVPAVWDGVVFDSREVRELAPVSAEDKAVIDSIDLPVAVKAQASTGVTREQADDVFEGIKHYFKGHNTLKNLPEKDARRSMNEACVDLAQKALDLGELEYADRFLWWMQERRSEIFYKLMGGTIRNLGVSFGLPKYIRELWDEFVPERDDEIADPTAPEDDSANDESESEQDSGYEEDDDEDSETPATLSTGYGLDDDDFGPTPVARDATPVPDVDDDYDSFGVKYEAVPAPVQEVEPEPNPFRYHREAFVGALSKETKLLQRPADRITIDLDSQADMRLGWVGKWLDSVSYSGKITHERVSQSILRVTLAWNVARYIVEHAELFVEDGRYDPNYKPVVDPTVLAEIEAGKQAAAAEERAAAALARWRREQAEAAELQRKADAEADELQRRKDAEAAEADRKVKQLEFNCRMVLVESTDDDGTFAFMAKNPDDIRIVREYLTQTFPGTFTVTYESASLLEGKVSSPLLEALASDPIGFRKNGYVETDANRELAAAA